MTATTKPDLSREAVEYVIYRMLLNDFEDEAETIRALLDAKEAAERQTAEAYRLLGNADKRQHQTDLELTEARAAAHPSAAPSDNCEACKSDMALVEAIEEFTTFPMTDGINYRKQFRLFQEAMIAAIASREAAAQKEGGE